MYKKIDDPSLIALTQLLELDVSSGEMKVFNQRVGIFPLNAVLQILVEVRSEIGEKKTNKIIRNSGIRFGEKLLESMMMLDKENFIDLNPLQGRESISKILSFFGLGKIEYVTDDDKTAVLNYYNSPVKEAKNNLFCILLTGILEGVLSKIYDKKIRVEEVSCVLKKADRCSFKIYLESYPVS